VTVFAFAGGSCASAAVAASAPAIAANPVHADIDFM
jgi:hypothetical protein